MIKIPSDLKFAIEQPCFAALATKEDNQEIQNHLMWIDFDKDFFLINTEQERKKTRNIRKNDTLTLLIFHPEQMYRSWEVRGRVIEVIQGTEANDHIDKLSERYVSKPYKREEGVAWEDAEIKDREIWIIKPHKILPMSSRGNQPKSE